MYYCSNVPKKAPILDYNRLKFNLTVGVGKDAKLH